MKFINLILKGKSFDLYQPFGRTGRINPFYIDHWISKFQDELPYKICIIRDFDILDDDKMDQTVDFLQKKYQKILVCSEGITTMEPIGWSRFPKMYDKVVWINNERPVPEHYKGEFFWPAHWFRTIQFYSKIKNSILNNPNKKYKCSLRIKNQRLWKDRLLETLAKENLIKEINLAIRHANPFVPNSPCFYKSEGDQFNEELPSKEQGQSFSIIVAETSDVQITEKTWQALFHSVPILFHSGPVVKKLTDYGFQINFEGLPIDYNLLDVTDNLVFTLKNVLNDIEDIYQVNLKTCEQNFDIVSSENEFNNIFKPLFFDKI